jgi:hypothetical protein
VFAQFFRFGSFVFGATVLIFSNINLERAKSPSSKRSFEKRSRFLFVSISFLFVSPVIVTAALVTVTAGMDRITAASDRITAEGSWLSAVIVTADEAGKTEFSERHFDIEN